MTRSAIAALIVALGMASAPAEAAVQGTYKPGQTLSFEPKPRPASTYRPQGERPRPAQTYRPQFEPKPTRPSFSAPPSPPKKSYTPPASR
jgi:hypothetical protein